MNNIRITLVTNPSLRLLVLHETVFLNLSFGHKLTSNNCVISALLYYSPYKYNDRYQYIFALFKIILVKLKCTQFPNIIDFMLYRASTVTMLIRM